MGNNPLYTVPYLLFFDGALRRDQFGGRTGIHLKFAVISCVSRYIFDGFEAFVCLLAE